MNQQQPEIIESIFVITGEGEMRIAFNELPSDCMNSPDVTCFISEQELLEARRSHRESYARVLEINTNLANDLVRAKSDKRRAVNGAYAWGLLFGVVIAMIGFGIAIVASR